MSRKIVVEKPKIPRGLRHVHFYDVLYDEEAELMSATAENDKVENEVIGRLILSKVVFKNQHIPKWNQLLKLAEEIHRTIPHHRYVAWDFALTNNGWVLIEGNSMGQFMSEFADKEGIKKEFDSLFD